MTSALRKRCGGGGDGDVAETLYAVGTFLWPDGLAPMFGGIIVILFGSVLLAGLGASGHELGRLIIDRFKKHDSHGGE